MSHMTGGPYSDWEHPGHPSAWEQTIGREKEKRTVQGKPARWVFFRDVVLPNIFAGIVVILFVLACGVIVAGTVMSG